MSFCACRTALAIHNVYIPAQLEFPNMVIRGMVSIDESTGSGVFQPSPQSCFDFGMTAVLRYRDSGRSFQVNCLACPAGLLHIHLSGFAKPDPSA